MFDYFKIFSGEAKKEVISHPIKPQDSLQKQKRNQDSNNLDKLPKETAKNIENFICLKNAKSINLEIETSNPKPVTLTENGQKEREKKTINDIKALLKPSFQQNFKLEDFKIKSEPKKDDQMLNLPTGNNIFPSFEQNEAQNANKDTEIQNTREIRKISYDSIQKVQPNDISSTNKKISKSSKKVKEFHEQKFKNAGPGTKLNLKQKWKDNFLGNTLSYKTRYMPNGKKKSFYKKPEKEEEDKIDELAPAKIEIAKVFQPADKTLITKENLYFQFMNEAVKYIQMSDDCMHLSDEIALLLNEKMNAIINGSNNLEGREFGELLQTYFKYVKFHDFQNQAIDFILNKKQNLLVNSFTGSGKSLIFQFYSLIADGLTVVIAPYVSMVVDQLRKIPKELPAIAFNSWLSFPQRDKFLELIKKNKVRLLFITPEMFNSDFFEFFIKNHQEVKIRMICVDEVHCCLPNSMSYRAAYSCIPQTIRQIQSINNGEIRILLLTATADFNARKYLCQDFGIPISNIINSGIYVRDNFQITFTNSCEQRKAILHILREKFSKKRPILLFCSFNKIAEMLSTFLTQNNINSLYFHSNLSEIQKMTILQKFALSCNKFDVNNAKKETSDLESWTMFSKTEVVLSTISLSMGLDIPNIKGIIHFNVPKFLEIYIQQIGRSGRSGDLSYCETLLNKSDYYFTRNKSISGYLINPESILGIINFFFGKINSNSESPILYNFIKKEKIKKSFFVDFDDFCWMLNFVRLAIYETTGEEIELYLQGRCDFRMQYGKNQKKVKDLMSNEDLEFMKCHAEENNYQFSGNIYKISTDLKQPLVKTIKFLGELAKKVNCELFFDNYGVGVGINENVLCHREEVINQTFIIIHRYFREVLFKIDVFYFMCSYLEKFNNKQENFTIFKDLSLNYFESEPDLFEAKLKEKFDYRNYCPLVFIETQIDFQKFIMPIFEEFFLENYKKLVDLMLSKKSHFIVYADSLRLLLGTVSDIFELKDWRNSKFWGALEHYSFDRFFEEIEMIFKKTFESKKMIVVEDFEENNELVNNEQHNLREDDIDDRSMEKVNQKPESLNQNVDDFLLKNTKKIHKN